jgi:hypothetical protein
MSRTSPESKARFLAETLPEEFDAELRRLAPTPEALDALFFHGLEEATARLAIQNFACRRLLEAERVALSEILDAVAAGESRAPGSPSARELILRRLDVIQKFAGNLTRYAEGAYLRLFDPRTPRDGRRREFVERLLAMIANGEEEEERRGRSSTTGETDETS